MGLAVKNNIWGWRHFSGARGISKVGYIRRGRIRRHLSGAGGISKVSNIWGLRQVSGVGGIFKVGMVAFQIIWVWQHKLPGFGIITYVATAVVQYLGLAAIMVTAELQ